MIKKKKIDRKNLIENKKKSFQILTQLDPLKYKMDFILEILQEHLYLEIDFFSLSKSLLLYY